MKKVCCLLCLVWTFCCRHSPLLGIQTVFLQVLQIFSKQCVLSMLNEFFCYLLCLVWTFCCRHSLILGIQIIFLQLFLIFSKLHKCFFSFRQRKKRCCLLCLVWIIGAAEVCFFSHIFFRGWLLPTEVNVSDCNKNSTIHQSLPAPKMTPRV